MSETVHTLLFFDGHPRAFPLYQALEAAILQRFEGVRIWVGKTQIGFYGEHLFACASFLPARKKADRPDPFLTVSFGLDTPLRHPRAVAVQVSPRRYTHHVLIGAPEEVDDVLMGWIEASYALSCKKTGKG